MPRDCVMRKSFVSYHLWERLLVLAAFFGGVIESVVKAAVAPKPAEMTPMAGIR